MPAGFPRQDLDVHAVRTARHELAKAQNDHIHLMRQIEQGLFAVMKSAPISSEAKVSFPSPLGMPFDRNAQEITESPIPEPVCMNC